MFKQIREKILDNCMRVNTKISHKNNGVLQKSLLIYGIQKSAQIPKKGFKVATPH